MGEALSGQPIGGRGRLIEVTSKQRFYLQYYTYNTFGTFKIIIIVRLKGSGHLIGGSLIGVQLYN